MSLIRQINLNEDGVVTTYDIAADAINVSYDSTKNIKTEIDNKANTTDLGTAAYKNTTDTYSDSGTDPVTGKAVKAAIDQLPKPMIYKGTLGVDGTITSLPAASSANEGYTYKVITDGTYSSIVCKVGDVLISNGSVQTLIPAGDTDSDTWRNIKVNGTEKLTTGISSGAVDFVNGDSTTVSFNATGNKIQVDAYKQLASNADLNTIVDSGFYYAESGNTITNAPTGVSTNYGFGLVVIHRSGDTNVTQILYYSGDSYRRYCTTSVTWTAWVKEDLYDTKVTQTATTSTYTNWRPLVIGSSSSATQGFSPNTATDVTYVSSLISVKPSDGTIFSGSLKSTGSVTVGTDASNSTGATMQFNSTNKSIDFVFI